MSTPPPLSSTGFLRWAWRQLTSMKTALVLLFLLALASVPGSVLPQRGIDPIKVREWIADAPTWGPILDRFGFFDVYSSPWFSAVYLLLFLSLVGCVIPRVGVHYRAMRSTPPPAPRFLDRFAGTRELPLQGTPAEALDAARTALRSAHWRVVSGPVDQPTWVSAERGYLRETGNLVFHVSLLLVLVSIAFGGLFGWKGNVIVRQGASFSNTLTQYDAWGGGRFASAQSLPPFSFTLDEFTVDFERGVAQRGAPRAFEADVTYRASPEAPAQRAVIAVNEPLAVDGAKVFLVGHGYAPVVRITDRQGTVVFDDAVPFLPQDGNFTSTGVVKVPDASPQIGLQALFLPTAALDQTLGPHSTFPAPDDPALFMSAWKGDLGLDAGEPQSVYRLVTDKMTKIGLGQLRPGQTWTLPDGSGTVTLAGYTRWASFQIAQDPGKEIALLAVAIAIMGLTLSLFIRRRRVWVKITDRDGVTVVQLAGILRTSTVDDEDIGALADDLDLLERSLAAAGVVPEPASPEEES
ncbi:MAG: cytochrome c biogenesis protein ResB [Candidatus Nanopelagicales bacterium]|nr:cytochrome c biogenesis protein ResB [Candidatus Nanopelagicales bacterium]